MATRINPSFNSFQEKILKGKSFNDGLKPADILKVIVGDWIKNLKESDREYYLRIIEKTEKKD